MGANDSSKPSQGHSASEISRWAVLVVDDEQDNLTVVEKVLGFHGATVVTAMDGQEGMRILESFKPSLILLDLSMPEMDGWEMLTRLRAGAATQDIPVIALTAHAMRGDEERVLAAGFNGYIAKPFRLNTFMGEIIRCVQAISSAAS